MLSLVIRAYSGPEALGATLRAAFPGVVSGLIADAIVVAPPGDSDSAEMADAAGAAHVVEMSFADGFQAACRRSRMHGILLFDGGVAVDEADLEAFRLKLPLREGAVLASAPVQMGMRGFLQRLAGRITRDQVLMLERGFAMTLPGDPWQMRFGRNLRIIPVRTERPGG
jgi:hypothetical protein